MSEKFTAGKLLEGKGLGGECKVSVGRIYGICRKSLQNGRLGWVMGGVGKVGKVLEGKGLGKMSI